MKQFEDLSGEESAEVLGKAAIWYAEHQGHVNRLIKGESMAYAPSGSDLLHPELWKAAHWRWLILHQ